MWGPWNNINKSQFSSHERYGRRMCKKRHPQNLRLGKEHYNVSFLYTLPYLTLPYWKGPQKIHSASCMCVCVYIYIYSFIYRINISVVVLFLLAAEHKKSFHYSLHSFIHYVVSTRNTYIHLLTHTHRRCVCVYAMVKQCWRGAKKIAFYLNFSFLMKIWNLILVFFPLVCSTIQLFCDMLSCTVHARYFHFSFPIHLIPVSSFSLHIVSSIK